MNYVWFNILAQSQILGLTLYVRVKAVCIKWRISIDFTFGRTLVGHAYNHHRNCFCKIYTFWHFWRLVLVKSCKQSIGITIPDIYKPLLSCLSRWHHCRFLLELFKFSITSSLNFFITCCSILFNKSSLTSSPPYLTIFLLCSIFGVRWIYF